MSEKKVTKEEVLKKIIIDIEKAWTEIDDEDGFHHVEHLISKDRAIEIIKDHLKDL